MTEYKCPSETELERKIDRLKEDEEWLMFEGIGNALMNPKN